MKLWLLAVAMCAVSTACIHQLVPLRLTGINYYVAPECKPSAMLIDCDTASPPQCKYNSIRFPKKCEQLVTEQAVKDWRK